MFGGQQSILRATLLSPNKTFRNKPPWSEVTPVAAKSNTDTVRSNLQFTRDNLTGR